MAVGGPHGVAVDAPGGDPLAAAALDRIVQSQDHGAASCERVDEEPEQVTAAGAWASRRPVEDAVGVHEPSPLCTPQDAQDARYRAAARRQDRADQQRLGMAPRAVDEQRRVRLNDRGEAGG